MRMGTIDGDSALHCARHRIAARRARKSHAGCNYYRIFANFQTRRGILRDRAGSLTALPQPRFLLSVKRVLKFLIPVAALVCAADLGAQNKACALATSDELTAALGATVSSLKPQDVSGTTEICVGATANVKVLLRLAQRSGDEGAKAKGETERKGIEIMKKMGARVDVKTFGAVTCSTITPPASMQDSGYNTTCSYSKKTGVATIETTAKTQKDAVPIDKLRPLAEKMADRF